MTRPDPLTLPTLTPALLQQLAPNGVLRAVINFGNPVLAQRDLTSGEPRGVSVDLVYALGQQLGLPVSLCGVEIAAQAVEALATGKGDLAFLAIDPQRAQQLSFTPPYVLITATYLVPNNSPFLLPQELDRAGVRIAAGEGAAYELHLRRTLKEASLVTAPTSAAAIERFVSEGLDAAAGVSQPLQAYARSHRKYRVLDGHFMSIAQAMAVPAGQDAALAYLTAFIEQKKVSSFVAEALVRSGQGEVAVAPAAG